MRRIYIRELALVALIVSTATLYAQETVKSGFDKLDEWTEQCHNDRPWTLGYPCNQVSSLADFYKWYTD